ncbi:MAG: type I DNA topoisomerase, partial [Parcubacteria group bacterium]|nr:type I DNA topoisomerase [Parcubacteria group bacterium]
MNLVIVESPTKAKTISRMLPGDFTVRSSYGHVRDLPKSKMGVDIEHDFEPSYIIPEKSKKIIDELKSEIKKAKCLILATDEDREGEAIAFHLIEALGLGNPKPETLNPKLKVERIVFHEITEGAIREALKNPRDIDIRLVDAQQARRVLDRLVGYELSPFLWRKISYGLSAGRVQSVALRIIVEREREIEAFTPEEYWEIAAKLRTNQEEFGATLATIDGKAVPQLGIKTKEEADAIANDLKNATFVIEKVDRRETKRRPSPPFTTSTLQQAAWQRLHFSAKQTMVIAQQLYEGIDLGDGPAGLITYMRTDSTNLSQESVAHARTFLAENLGKNYALPAPRFFKT